MQKYPGTVVAVTARPHRAVIIDADASELILLLDTLCAAGIPA